MLTYNRGQWGEDPGQENAWKPDGSANDNFFNLYSKRADYEFGNDYGFRVHIHNAVDYSIKYPYAAYVGNGDVGVFAWVCLPDFPSVFMLIKESLPIIQYEKRTEIWEMQEEEHQWKAIDEERYPRNKDRDEDKKKRCGHLW